MWLVCLPVYDVVATVCASPLFEPQRKQHKLRGAVRFRGPFAGPTGQRGVHTPNSKPNLPRKRGATASSNSNEQFAYIKNTRESARRRQVHKCETRLQPRQRASNIVCASGGCSIQMITPNHCGTGCRNAASRRFFFYFLVVSCA